VSQDGSLVYCGRGNLNVLKRDSATDNYELISSGKDIKRFVDIKVIGDGTLIVTDQDTSDLIKYNDSLKPVKRVNGKKALNLNGSQITSTLYCGDDILFIWMLGDNSIAIANPQTLAFDLIPNFFGLPSEEITPFSTVASLYEHKLVGLYIKSSLINIVFMRNAKTTVRKNIAEIVSQGETILCLESARQKDIFFAGGGTEFKLKNGKAKLFALSFDEEVKMKTSVILDSSSSMGISCMKRIRDSDVLILGTNGSLFLVQYLYESFE
jgi:hypothetical protein